MCVKVDKTKISVSLSLVMVSIELKYRLSPYSRLQLHKKEANVVINSMVGLPK